MNNKYTTITLINLIISIFLLTLGGAGVARGWTEPRQLTNGVPVSNPRAAGAGRNLYLVGWPGAGDFYFLRSWDNGRSWLEPVQPADTFYAGSEMVDIARTADGSIHVVWKGWFPGGDRIQLFHQSSSDNGGHWSDRHHVFENADLSLAYPRLAIQGDTLFLIYTSGGNMYFTRSIDSGLTWEPPRIVDTSQGMSNPPTILRSRERLHIIYQLNIGDGGGIKVFYTHSDDGGLSWTPRIYLSTYEHGPPFYDSQSPSAYADGDGHIVAAWFDYQYGSMCGVTGDILARVSTDNGQNWLPEARVTYTQSGHRTSCLVLNGTIYIAWDDTWRFGCDYPKIVLSSSADWGGTWSPPELITANGVTEERAPFLWHSLERADTLLHCFYVLDDPTHGYDLYYVRNLPFYSRVKEAPGEAPVALGLNAAPSVFHSITALQFENGDGGEMLIEIYNVLGQRIWGTRVRGKEGNVIWHGRDDRGAKVASGIYFAKVASAVSSRGVKLVYLK